jgi:hypothetical protein
MTMGTRLAAIGLGVVLAGGVCVMAGAQGRGNAATSKATLTLAMSGGSCGKTLVGNDPDAGFKDRLRARRGGAVEWTVINNCTADATVKLTDWIRKADKGAESPVDPAGKDECTAAAGKQCVIALHIRGNAGIVTYSYSTTVNGVTKDPDLIIEG